MCLLWSGVAVVHAHELRPAIATIQFQDAGEFELTISLNLEAAMAGIGPHHADTSHSENAGDYDRLRRLSPSALAAEFDTYASQFLAGIRLAFDSDRARLQLVRRNLPETGDVGLARISEIVLRGTAPEGAGTLVWELDPRLGDSVIRIRKAGSGDILHSGYVSSGKRSEPITLATAAPPSTWSVFANYVAVGFEHIVPKGLDHILFIIGLFLLSPRLKPLLWQVTTFTLAHSLTLALSMLGVLKLPSSIVEPLIALSIVYVAVENMMTDRLQRWRPAVIFAFGLLHGLGFAGVLSEVGLSTADFAAGLIAFNVGVELGQLAVVAACFLTVGLFRGASFYRSAITVPASLVIAVVGAYWFIERVS
jgi:hypothetical protein